MLLRQNFEAVASGTTISVANSSGYGNGDAFSAVTIGNNASIVYDNTHAFSGVQAGKFATGSTKTSAHCDWAPAGAADLFIRFYIYPDGWPPGSGTIRLILMSNSANGHAFVGFTAAGKVQLFTGSGVAGPASASTVPTGAWSRVEAHLPLGATGTLECKLFPGAADVEKLTPTAAGDTFTLTNVSGQATYNNLQVGCSTNTSNLPNIWIDALEINDSRYPGPLPRKPTSVVTPAALMGSVI